MLGLLGLNTVKDNLAIKEQQSSLDDWQREAKRLESHGKKSQADEIRKNILHQVPVPWKVLSFSDVEVALPFALDPTQYDKKNQRLVFDMAFVHGWSWILPELVKAKYSLAADKRESDYCAPKILCRFQSQRHHKFKNARYETRR